MNAHDRCDQCSAQAQARVTKGALELLFCGHHFRTYVPKLLAGGWTVAQEPQASHAGVSTSPAAIAGI